MKRIILVLVALFVLFPGCVLAQHHGPGPGHGWNGHRPPPPPPPAYHGHRGHHGGGDPGAAIAVGVIGALAVGALAAGAMAAQQPAPPPPGYYPPQGYYPPPPPAGYYPQGYTPPMRMCNGRQIPINAPCIIPQYCLRDGIRVFCGYR